MRRTLFAVLACIALPGSLGADTGRPVLVQNLCTAAAPAGTTVSGVSMAAAGNRVYMSVTPAGRRPELVTLDATTGEVLSTIRLGIDTYWEGATVRGTLGNEALLSLIDSETGGQAVAATDGTIAGTRLLMNDGVSLVGLTFPAFAQHSAFSIPQPLLIHITTQGWSHVAAPNLIGARLAYENPHVAILGERALFVGESSTGNDPWITDGTPEGTQKLVDVVSGNPPPRFVAGQSIGYVFHRPGTLPTTTENLWVTNGSAAGTSLVTTLAPGLFTVQGEREAGHPPLVGNRVYFLVRGAPNGNEPQLWTSDGTAAGTHLVLDVTPDQPDTDFLGYTAFQGRLYFQVRSNETLSMWRTATDGSGAEPLPWLPSPGEERVFNQPNFITVGGLLYLFRQTAEGVELWRSDGTADGTVRLNAAAADLFGAAGARIALTDGVLFSANQSGRGDGIYRADASGLRRLLDIGRLPQQSCDSSAEALAALPSGVVVRAGDQLYRLSQLGQPMTPLGATLAASRYTVVNGIMVYVGTDVSGGAEPWRTDGTPAGTFRLADLFPGPTGSMPTNGAVLRELPTLDGLVYFAANSPEVGLEIFRTDGSAAGTSLLHDLRPGVASTSIPTIVASGGRLFISAFSGSVRNLFVSDGRTDPPVEPRPGMVIENTADLLPIPSGVVIRSGRRLGRSDGTLEGTFAPVDNADPLFSAATYLATIDDLILTQSASLTLPRLWSADGTVTGSQLLAGPGAATSATEYTGRAGGIGYTAIFGARDIDAGAELWRTDGTFAGTARIADLWPGAEGSWPRVMYAEPGLAVISAETPERGRELWITDGTEAGTRALPEVTPGAEGFLDEGTAAGVRIGSRIYFTAAAGDGTELYVLPLCTADFDGNGVRGVSDIFDYLTAYIGGRTQFSPVGADFDGNGALGLDDLFLFLTTWFDGC